MIGAKGYGLRGGRRIIRAFRVQALRAGAFVATLLLAAGHGAAPSARAETPAGVATSDWKTYTTGLAVTGLRSLMIHPRVPDVLWGIVDGLGPAKSTNGGQTWSVHAEGIDKKDLPGPRDPATLTLDPREVKTVYLVTRGIIYKTENEGKAWTSITTQALASYTLDRRQTMMRIAGVAIDPGNSRHLLAGTRAGEGFDGGLYESLDGGKRWSQLAGSNLKAKDKDEGTGLGRDAWPISLDSKTNNVILVGGEEGLFLSVDRGNHFEPVSLGEEAGPHDIRDLTDIVQKDVYACDARGVWFSSNSAKKWGKQPLLAGDAVSVEIDWKGKRAFAVLHDRGILLSEDARHEKWGKKTPYAELEVRELVFHPRDRDVMFAASRVTGLHVSKDRGETFAPVASNLPAVVPEMAAVAGHRAEDGRFLAATAEGVVFASGDRAVTWERVGRLGMAPISLLGGAAKDDWWAAGARLLRSADGGKTWTTIYTPEAHEDRIVGFDRAEDGSLNLLLERERIVLTSKDDGKTWTEKRTAVGDSSRAVWATGLAVDPRNGEHLLVSTRSRTAPWNPKDEEGGPYESWDGGKTWRALREGLFTKDEPRRQWNYGRVVGIDPANGNLYYGAEGAGLFVRRAEPPADKSADKPGNDKGKEEKAAAPEWEAVSDGGVPTPSFHAFWLGVTRDGADSELIVQVAGENDARAVLVTAGSKLAALLQPPAEGAEKTRPWDADRIKDPGTRLFSLTADPSVPGRLVAADRMGERGILVLEPTGQAPAAPGEAAPTEPTKPEEAKPTGPEPAKPPDVLVAVSVGADKQIRAFDPAGGKALRTSSDHQGEVFAAALSPDGQTIATGSADRTIRLWKSADGAAVATLGPAENAAAVTALAFHPQGNVLYAGCRENWAIVRWDLVSKKAKRLEGHAGGVLALAISKDGTRLYSSGEDGRVLVWDTATDARVPIEGFAFPGEVHALVLSADGLRLFVAGQATTLHVYSTADGVETGKVDLAPSPAAAKVEPAPSHGSHGAVLSSDGTLLYVAGSSGLRSLKADDLSSVASFAGPTAEVDCVTLSSDGAWLLAGDAAGTLWLWDVAAPGKPAWTVPAAHAGGIHGVLLTAGAGAAPPATPNAPPAPPAEGSPPVPPAGGGAPPGGAAPPVPPAPSPSAPPVPPVPPADEK